MSVVTLVLLLAGLVMLVIGAEALVRGASSLAAIVGISPLVIGLTIVAYGTSSPEMAVSVMSSLTGQADITVGNVVGSNIFNILLILGISALVTPLVVARQLIRLDVPIMIGASFLMLVFGLDGKISRVDGTILVVGCLAYTAFLLYKSRKQSNRNSENEYTQGYGNSSNRSLGRWLSNLGLIVAGLGLLILGSRWLVAGAIVIAKAVGVSELVIGLTIIAGGTSLPELATSAIASWRGERDIAVGNVVGSNIFNILAVLGVSSVIAPDGINVSTEILQFDGLVMIAAAVICLPIFATGNRIGRWEGVVFAFYYIAYTTYLVLNSTQHEQLPLFTTVMLAFVIPLSAIILVIVTWRSWQRSSSLKRQR